MRNRMNRRPRAKAVGFLLACGCLVGSAPAWAEPTPSSPGDDLSKQAEILYGLGADAKREQRSEDARKFYLAASLLQKHWQIVANLGSVELTLGMARDAAEHLAQALQMGPPPKERQQIQELFDKARAAVGELTIGASVAGAEILVDGKVVGRAPLGRSIFVKPGERVIEARREKYSSGRMRKTMEAGSAERITLTLLPEEIAAPQRAPLAASPLPDASSSTCAPVIVRRSSAGAAVMPAAVAGLIGNAVALGIGVGLHGYASTKVNDVVSPAMENAAEWARRETDGRRLANNSTLVLSVGNAIGIVTNSIMIISIASSSGQRSDTGAAWRLNVGVGGASVSGLF